MFIGQTDLCWPISCQAQVNRAACFDHALISLIDILKERRYCFCLGTFLGF